MTPTLLTGSRNLSNSIVQKCDNNLNSFRSSSPLHFTPQVPETGAGSVVAAAVYELPIASGTGTTERLNSELDSFYSDIASIECNQVAAASEDQLPVESSGAVAGGGCASTSVPQRIVDVSSNKGTVGEKVSKSVTTVTKKKKVKTSLSDIKQMSHLISKWQEASRDL